MTATAASEKILFAHLLRGVAAVLVVMHHFTTILWASPAAIDTMLNMPAPRFTGGFAAVLRTVDAWLAPLWLDFSHWGALGVALFFLISGFVIPFAVTATNRRDFLLSRWWRLWPTYAVGLAVVLGVITFTTLLAGRTLQLHLGSILAHLTFMWDFLTPLSYDAVSWTLVIEVRFYIVCALLMPLLRRGDIIGLGVIGAGLLTMAAVVGIWSSPDLLPPIYLWPSIAVGRTASMMLFMLIGVTFNFHQRECITTTQLCGGVAWFFALFCGAYLIGAWSYGMAEYVIVYGYAVLGFAVAYATRSAWRNLHWLDGAARLSYPLYVLHAVCGYAVITVLVTYGVNPGIAFGGAWVVVIGLAWCLHRWVETPTHAIARTLRTRRQEP